MPLTGGYRRTPVMQIGADVYCDTQIIVRELERRFPQPPAFPSGSEGISWMVSMWSDRPFFQAAIGVIFGGIREVPADFIEDRAQLSGRTMDVAAMRAAAPLAREQFRAHASWIEEQLADGRRFLLGGQPTYADITAYMNVWWVGQATSGAAELLAGFALLGAWAERLASLGHGKRVEMTSGEALEIARTASPETAIVDGVTDAERRPGARVKVVPDDYGRIPVEGELVVATEHRLAIRRHDPRAGEVVVHFPRVGFVVQDV
jgi:glutathione S-transferase